MKDNKRPDENMLDELTNYIMDEFVRGKITTFNIDTDEDDEMYTKIWNNINAMIYDDGR